MNFLLVKASEIFVLEKKKDPLVILLTKIRFFLLVEASDFFSRIFSLASTNKTFQEYFH